MNGIALFHESGEIKILEIQTKGSTPKKPTLLLLESQRENKGLIAFSKPFNSPPNEEEDKQIWYFIYKS